MTRAFWRCNGGHYFNSVHCPFDGWSSKELSELNTASQKLNAKGENPTIAGLRSEGASELALRRAIVVEFGNERSAFDAISPDHYVLGGKAVPLRNVGFGFY